MRRAFKDSFKRPEAMALPGIIALTLLPPINTTNLLTTPPCPVMLVGDPTIACCMNRDKPCALQWEEDTRHALRAIFPGFNASHAIPARMGTQSLPLRDRWDEANQSYQHSSTLRAPSIMPLDPI